MLVALAACTSEPPSARPKTAAPSTTHVPPPSTTAPTPPTTPAATAPPTTAAPLTPCAASGSWPLRQKLAQLLFATVTTSSSTQAERVLRTPTPVGGLFLGPGPDTIFAGGGVHELIAGMAVPPLVAVDEEGGRVQRIDDLHGAIPSARVQATTMTPEEVRSLAAKRGAALAQLGITMDFAPVVDVSSQPAGAVIGSRSYSPDPVRVATYAGAFADGLRQAGILPTLKHFPGHGRAVGNSHSSVAVAPEISDLRSVDLVPYRELLAARPAAVMVGHLDVPGLTEPGLPSSLSPATYRLLREEFEFDGLAVTDSLGMAAVSRRFPLTEAVGMALAAGADMALVPPRTVPVLLDHLEADVQAGRLTMARVDDALAHVLAAKRC